MMQLCEAKNCWLADLDDIPADELELWSAFYFLEEERRRRESGK